MKTISMHALRAVGLMLLALAGGCAVDSSETTAENSEAITPALEGGDDGQSAWNDGNNNNNNGFVEVHLDSIGLPLWKPVDFHHFSAPYADALAIFEALLPPPRHVSHPQLGIGPGAPHWGPYDDELDDGVDALGYTDKSKFTAAQFTQGTLLAFMVVPKSSGNPKGKSPDFIKGPIIPNWLFPIHVKIQYVRNGAVNPVPIEFDVPALNQSLSPPFNVDGHSHFPIVGNDSSVFYNGAPAAGSYERRIKMLDVKGNGWSIRIPFKVY